MKAVVADSSTLITLLDTDHFDILFKLFEKILISEEVYKELTCKQLHLPTIDNFLKNQQIIICHIEHADLFEMLIKHLDKGESESIVLAKKRELPLVIDEKKGRTIAKSIGIGVIGLIGILLKLMDSHIITKEKAIAIVDDVESNNFRLSSELKKLVYEYYLKTACKR